MARILARLGKFPASYTAAYYCSVAYVTEQPSCTPAETAEFVRKKTPAPNCRGFCFTHRLT
jgi:hypothetical protein